MRFLPKSRRSWVVTTVVAVLASAVGWHAAAYPRGMLMARLDHARGHHEVKAWGPDSEPDTLNSNDLLRQRYGVGTNWMTGDAVSWQEKRYANGYNSVSRRRLIATHGKDIFAECSALVWLGLEVNEDAKAGLP